jgi:ubiquinone biosynthesis protein UbiJ
MFGETGLPSRDEGIGRCRPNTCAQRGRILAHKPASSGIDLGQQAGVRAYNPAMLEPLTSSLRAAAAERLALLLNHVLAAEPAATERLRSHSGRSAQLQLSGLPALLPLLPELSFRVTPAGLLEWCGSEPPAEPDLRLRLDAANPTLALAQWAAGEKPQVELQGDARFAADLSWLMDNLRWDVQDDLARVVGRAPAYELARVGKQLASGLRAALRTLSSWAAPAGSPPR